MKAGKKKLIIVRQHSVFVDRRPSFGIWREELIKKAYSKNNSTIIASKFDHYKKKIRDEKKTKNRIFLFSFGYKNNISFFRFLDQLVFGLQVMIWILMRASKNSIFLFSYPTQEAAFLGSIACYLKKIPFCIDIRDIVPPSAPKKSVLLLFYYIYAKSINYLTFKICKKYMFMSFGLFQKYKKNITDTAKKEIIHNPVKVFYKFKKQKINTLTFLGNLNNSFDFENLKNCPEKIKINIVGSGENLKNLKFQFRAKQNIKFFGALSAKKINEICKKTHAFFAFYKSKNFENHLTNKMIFYIKYNKPIYHNLGKFNLHAGKKISIGTCINPNQLFETIKDFRQNRPFDMLDLRKLSFAQFRKKINLFLK